MKECEIFSNLKVPCGSKLVLRLDGRSFYMLSKECGLEKPYDSLFVDAMVNTAIYIMREFSPSFIYTFSDEFNILMDHVPFSGRVEKMDSVFASFSATSFLHNFNKNLLKSEECNSGKSRVLNTVSFDSRVIPLSSEMVMNYFKSRQDESWRNCLNGYAYWTLRDEMDKNQAMNQLKGLKSSQIHDLLFERGINISEVPAWQRRGVGIYKGEIEIKGYNPLHKKDVLTTRKKIITDWDLPIFNQDFFQEMEL
ncbi:MAG: guanylyltransferase [Euryarchaeota archaeon]|nr:guanylyltransferase [Euryarchaeota archaeon]MBU4548006.1 guanylyltransferase [Euryarchaeota archaeon]MBV1754623.1 guanylyltransferase [Methanobacterium sp.]MBV1768017.1 guanylyltransferase [Methanobacterium sp.]